MSLKFNAMHTAINNVEDSVLRADLFKVMRSCAQNAYDTIFVERSREACEFELVCEGTLVSVLCDFRHYLGDAKRELRVRNWFDKQGFIW